jgi:outer membrane biosynthesis protein TonB
MREVLVAIILLAGAGVANAGPGKPDVSFGAATTTPSVDEAMLRKLEKVIKRSASKLRACFKKARSTAPDLAGEVTAHFTIGADGKVSAAAATGLDEALDGCVAAAIKRLAFAKLDTGTSLDVTVPLTFEVAPVIAQGGAFASLTGTGDISSGFDDTNIYGGLLGNEAGEMSGGFGQGSGSGPGAGGIGWGTIGTGRYGSIGHGSGTGSGYGVGGGRGGMRRRSVAAPTTSTGTPTTTGDLDKAIIRRYIKRNIMKITYCYEKKLLEQPKLAGKVTAEFTIGANGVVSAAAATGLDDEVAACVASVIKAIEFPKPKGGDVRVSYPFIFRAGDSE